MAINLTVKEAEVPEPIPEDMYDAAVVLIEEETGEFGDYLKFTFEISKGEYKGVTRTSLASKKLSKSKSGKTSKLYEYTKALTKSEPKAGESFDVEELNGKICKILVKNKEKDGIIYQTITEVMPS